MPPKNIVYAGFWIRLSAAIWDSIIVGIPASIIQLILLWVTGVASVQYLISLIAVAIFVYMEGTKGGTPGKLILGLQVQNEKGQIIGVPNAILRYIGKIISALILGIGYLMIAWDPKKQGLHDKIAKTFVVKQQEKRGLVVLGFILGFFLYIVIPIVLIGILVYYIIQNPQTLLSITQR